MHDKVTDNKIAHKLLEEELESLHQKVLTASLSIVEFERYLEMTIKQMGYLIHEANRYDERVNHIKNRIIDLEANYKLRDNNINFFLDLISNWKLFTFILTIMLTSDLINIIYFLLKVVPNG